MNTEEFVKRSKDKHGDAYDYSKSVFVNKKTKVEIYCPKHDLTFFQQPYNHCGTLGQRCPKCGRESGNSKQNTLTVDQFVSKSKELHGDKYDYSKTEYKNSYTKVIITCKKHGDYEMRPKDHLKAGVYENGNLMCSGCPKCGDIRAAVNRTKSTGHFIEKAIIAHGEEKFDYSKVNYKHIHENVKIICNKHNLEFETSPGNFNRNSYNCPECVKEASFELKITKEEFLEDCLKVHNGLYDYSEVEYNGVVNYVKNIKCAKHGLFNQVGYAHKRGQGCPHCCTSKGELAVKSYLEFNNIKFEQQKTFPNCIHKSALKFDFYLPDHNVAIEFQGRQHFEEVSYFGGEEGFQETVLRDEIKSDYCKNNYIELICLSDTNEIESKLNKFSELQLV